MFTDYIELHKLTLTVDGTVYDLVSAQITGALGGAAQCVVLIADGYVFNTSKASILSGTSSGAGSALKHGAECHVDLAYNNSTVTLFTGYVQGISSTKAGTHNAVQEYTEVSIALPVTLLDTLPVAQMSLVTVAAGGQISKTSFMTMNNRSLSQHTDATQGNMYVNVAKFIQQIIDGVCFDDKAKQNHNRLIAGGSAGVAKVVDTSTCPRLSIRPNSDFAVADLITKHVLSMLAQGATYLNTFSSLCSMFYLTQSPDMANGKIKVIPDLAWRKKHSVTLSESDIIGITQTSTGTGKNQVDAVIVGYSQSPKIDPTANPSPEGSVVYGEGIGNNGAARAITDPKELLDLTAAVPRKYITAMLPSWVSHFSHPVKETSSRKIVTVSRQQDPVCTEFTGSNAYDNNAIRWASAIARTMFAKLNRENATCHITTTLPVGLDLCDHIGHIIKVDRPSVGINNTFGTICGRLEAIQIHIKSGIDNISVTCTAVLSHVRTEATNNTLGIDDCVYVDNW